MKKLILIFLSLQTVVLYGQVTYPHNSLRVGDKIVKQQVKHKDLEREEDNIIWDFGGLDPINEEHYVVYSEYPREITTYYDYDDFGHLKRTYIQEGEVQKTIETYKYHYRNQQD